MILLPFLKFCYNFATVDFIIPMKLNTVVVNDGISP